MIAESHPQKVKKPRTQPQLQADEREKEVKADMKREKEEVKKILGEQIQCCYCEIKPETVKLFVTYFKYKDEYRDNKQRDASRGGKRGQNLEVERVKPGGLYKVDNCEWACYPCNNAKSNFNFTEEEFKPIATAIHQAIEDKLISKARTDKNLKDKLTLLGLI